MRTPWLSALPLLAGLLVLGSGCVSKKDHEALQKQLDDVSAQLQGANAKTAEQDQQIQDLSAALAELERQLAEGRDREVVMQESLAQMEDELRVLNELKAKTDEELANVLKNKKALKASIDAMRLALDALAKRRLAAEKRVAEYRRLLAKFKDLIDSGKLNVKIVDGRMVLVLPTDILFKSGRAGISEEGKAAIMQVGEVLKTIPEKAFQVEGHTDNVPIRTKTYRNNWELAYARAMQVVDVLLESGVEPGQLSAASFGENKPASTNDSDEGKAKNRRIEIVVVPDLSGLPGFDELNELGLGS